MTGFVLLFFLRSKRSFAQRFVILVQGGDLRRRE